MRNCSRVIAAALFLPIALGWPASAIGAASARASQAQAVPVRAPWWQNAVIYEIYPRSFQDSDGDGVGDLNGIVQRLDYLKALGIDAIWLTPIYPSPQADFGYDISDFTAIDPLYGSMADFDHLVAEARKRDIRVIMDLVLNHTSDEHPWFKESRSSRTNPKRGWYIWRDGKAGGGVHPRPPNNWANRIEQSPWQWDPATHQFYYHYYDVRQPDLNWRNPAVERAMFDAAEFWLQRGVAGFRLDAINTLFEREDLADAPAGQGTNEYGEPSVSMVYQRNQPEVHDVLRRLRAFTDRFGRNDVLIGEVYTYSTSEWGSWFGTATAPELHLPMNTNVGFLNRLDAKGFRTLLSEAETSFPDRVPLYVFDNHDRPRSWDRYGDGRNNERIAKIIATILLASRSTALVYQGQEIGMATTTPSRKEDVRDPRGIAGWPQEKGRDGERTPMQWSASKNAGFTTAAKPWLPVPESYTERNVETEQRKPDSLLNWYRSLINFKRRTLALRTGTAVFINRDRQNALVWLRRPASGSGGPAILALCNLSDQPIRLDLSRDLASVGIDTPTLVPILATDENSAPISVAAIRLQPFGTMLAEVPQTDGTKWTAPDNERYVGTPMLGVIASISVSRGQSFSAGGPLISLKPKGAGEHRAIVTRKLRQAGLEHQPAEPN